MSVAGFKFIFLLKINILELNLLQKVGYIEEKNIFRLISAQFNVHISVCAHLMNMHYFAVRII